MDWIKNSHTLKAVEEEIDYKLSALRERIWKELENIPLADRIEFVRDLRIGALFTTDADTYVEMQAELSHVANRLANGKAVDNESAKELLKRLIRGENE